MSVSLEQTGSVVREQNQPDNSHTPSRRERVTETPLHSPNSCSPPLLTVGPEDPLAGMYALLTASEMVIQPRPGTPPAPTLEPQRDGSPVGADYSSAASLEMVALEGMALLSQMAQSDMKHISQEHGA